MIHVVALKAVTLPHNGSVMDFETPISAGDGVTDIFLSCISLEFMRVLTL